ncbi:hypothetical protein ACJMK2_015754 [Sinanodonta woodiana]|uniref:SEFIR domain-containing protein n=1 Tax=Sinanodonta woodiana TaxID=1069815 RepID=A0ABD3URP6_SINWO
MALQYILLVSLLSSLSLSNDNGLQLWKDCPSIQSIQGSKGSHFEITIQMFNNACTDLLSISDKEKAYNFSKRSNNLNMQLTVNKERANITWSLIYNNWCQRRLFMLDVEYRVKNAEGNGAYISHWCFQYNLSKGQPKQKEKVTFYFDCIRTIPDREAYLINIKLWSLQQGWPLSSRIRRSVKSHCSGISCTTSLKDFLEIGPIKTITSQQDDPEITQICQCWSNSSISLKQNTDAEGRYLSIVVDNPNPYASLITVKVYEKEIDTLPIFSQTSRLSPPAVKVSPFLTHISCENQEGTYTPVLGYDCGGRGPFINDLCEAHTINGQAIHCPVKMKPISPTDGIPHVTIILLVLSGVAVVVMVVTVSYNVCKARKKKPGTHHHDSRLLSQSPNETEMNNLEEVSKARVHYPEYADPHRGRRQITLLYHTDSSTSLIRKDCVNVITELLTGSNIDVLGLDRVTLFRNWVELVERASKDDITEFLIIISSELVSFHNFYMTSSNNIDAICTESQNSNEYFCCAVLKALRDRYFQPGRVPFRIHILCLEHSDSQLCKKYIDTYSSFMIAEHQTKNTFIYCFAKYLEDTKSFVFDDTVLALLFKRLNGTATLPEITGETLGTTNTKRWAMKLKLQLEALFEESNQHILRKS